MLKQYKQALRYTICSAVVGFSSLSTGFAAQVVINDGTTTTLPDGDSYQNVNNTIGGSALSATGAGSTIIGSGITLSDGGFTDTNVGHASNGGKINLTDSDITGRKGLYATDAGSEIIVTGGSITTEHEGLWIENGASATLENVTIEAGYGVTSVNGSSLNLLGGTIKNGGQGVSLGWGNHFIDGTHISTTGVGVSVGPDMWGTDAYLMMKNFSIDAGGEGVRIGSNSSADLSNGIIETHGDLANGITIHFNDQPGYALTASNIKITTHGDIAYGIANFGANIDLKDVDISVLLAHGIYGQTAKMTFDGGSITSAGNGVWGVVAVGGSDYWLNNVVVRGEADGTGGIIATSQSKIVFNNGSITTQNGYAVQAATQSEIAIDNSTIITSDISGSGLTFLTLPGIIANNKITLTNSSVNTPDAVAVLADGGNDILDVRDSIITGDKLVHVQDISGHGLFFGSNLAFNAVHSMLKGGAFVTDASTLVVNLANGSNWTLTPAKDMTVDSSVSVLNIDNSTVGFEMSVNNMYQTLTVGAGTPATENVYNAIGNAGLILNTHLNQGGALANQKTDRLLVNGNVSGTTMVTVNGVTGSEGGSTSVSGNNAADEGISLIQVSGQATDKSFLLAGGYVTMSGLPYQYTLHAYGPGSLNGNADEGQRLVDGTSPFWDFRLQNEYIVPPTKPEKPVREVVPQVANYLVAPIAIFQANMMDIGSLHRRLGEIRDNPSGTDSGRGEFFMRTYGGSYDYASNRTMHQYGYDSKFKYAAIQAGSNLYAFEGKESLTQFGVAGNYGSLSFDPRHVANTEDTDMKLWSVSAYATYLRQSGWYVDAGLFYGGFKGDVSTSLRDKTANLSGNSLAVSLETGVPINLNTDDVIFEPQMQLVYQRLMFDRTYDVDKFIVLLGNLDQWTVRVGGRLSKTFASDISEREITIYGKINLRHTFGDAERVNLGDNFNLGEFGSSIEGGFGIDATLSKAASLYTNIAYQNRLSDAGINGLSLNGGFKHSF